MNNQQKDKRKSKGCPVPIVYFSLEIVAFALVLYMAYSFHVPISILLALLAGFTLFSLNKTSRVCARQKIYTQHYHASN